jgi:small subunit ribosomal protein S1
MVKVIKEGSDEARNPSPGEFEALLNESQEAGLVLPGEIVTGRVVSVGREWVFVDLGGKSEGVIAVTELTDEEGKVKAGDDVEATVLTTRGGVRLSVKLSKGSQNDSVLRDAFENQIPIEGRVLEVNKGGFVVDIGSTRAFCPVSQIDSSFVEKPEQYLNQAFTFRIIDYKPEAGNVVVSRRVILEAERKAMAAQMKAGIKVGQLLSGVVKKLMPFGAFVDIGGMDGLVHVSQICWDRVDDPAKVLQEGQRVQVKVLQFDTNTDKLSLSIKEAGVDPWSQVGDRWPVGSAVEGEVMRLERFGAFVKLEPGLEGLVHISEMSWVGRVRHPSDLLTVGQRIRVIILGVDPNQKRISLGMKQLSDDPWSDVDTRYAVDSMVLGKVDHIASGGVFINLEEGITGFLPGSLAGLAPGEPLGSGFKIGKDVKLKVKEVDAERRRITLMADDSADREERDAVQQHFAKQNAQSTKKPDNDKGSFGKLLEDALKSGKFPTRD